MNKKILSFGLYIMLGIVLTLGIAAAAEYLVEISTTQKQDVILNKFCNEKGIMNKEECIPELLYDDLDVGYGKSYEEDFAMLVDKCILNNMQEECHKALVPVFK